MTARNRPGSARGMRLAPATDGRSVDPELLGNKRPATKSFNDRVGRLAGMDGLCRHVDFAHLMRLTQQETYPIVALLANDVHEQQMNIDWFRHLIAAKKLSQRKLAKLLDLDPAAISLMLRGQRRMTNAEAHQMSIILGVPM